MDRVGPVASKIAVAEIVGKDEDDVRQGGAHVSAGGSGAGLTQRREGAEKDGVDVRRYYADR